MSVKDKVQNLMTIIVTSMTARSMPQNCVIQKIWLPQLYDPDIGLEYYEERDSETLVSDIGKENKVLNSLA